jgi:hypothetical protein
MQRHTAYSIGAEVSEKRSASILKVENENSKLNVITSKNTTILISTAGKT